MAYDEWVIGGLTPSWIVDVQYNHENREITLTCRADHNRLSDLDPRSEIEQFQEMQCDVISNTQLMNGGSCLQTCNGDPIIITDGVDSWVAALKKVNYLADYQSQLNIDYQLVLEYETHSDGIIYSITGSGDEDNPTPDDGDDDNGGNDGNNTTISSKTYYPPFVGLSNITYWCFTDETELNQCSNSMGKMIITEPRNVKQVIVKSKRYAELADPKPNIYIEVNGSRQNYSNEEMWGFPETMTWDIDPPSSTITINSPDNTSDKARVRRPELIQYLSKGILVSSITVVYE
jgi:hypothetical protein